jgi:hypothetical protein
MPGRIAWSTLEALDGIGRHGGAQANGTPRRRIEAVQQLFLADAHTSCGEGWKFDRRIAVQLRSEKMEFEGS